MLLNKILFCLLVIGFTFASQKNFIINESVSDDGIFISGFLKKYLFNYFKNENAFISITISSSQSLWNEFYKEFFRTFFDSSFENNFSYSLLHELDNTSRMRRRGINLILVEDSHALL